MSEVKHSGDEIVGRVSHELRTGLPCENCGELIERRYCGTCGQLAADYHKPLSGLLVASLADMLALDGRLSRTLREMILKPGQMTRNYLDGQRARYVPPFRLYIFASLIFFFMVFSQGTGGAPSDLESDPAAGEVPAIAAADEEGSPEVPGTGIEEIFDEDGHLDGEALNEIITEGTETGDLDVRERALIERFAERVNEINENPERFLSLLKTYAPRASLVMVPLLAIMLALLYVNKRRVMLYDHLVTALHFQVFIYFSVTVVVVLGMIYSPLGAVGWIGLVPFLFYYGYRQQRRVYAGGRIITVVRTAILSAAISVFLMLIMIGSVLTAVMRT